MAGRVAKSASAAAGGGDVRGALHDAPDQAGLEGIEQGAIREPVLADADGEKAHELLGRGPRERAGSSRSRTTSSLPAQSGQPKSLSTHPSA